MKIFKPEIPAKGRNILLVHIDDTNDEINIVSRSGEAIRISTPSSSDEFEIVRTSARVDAKKERIYPQKQD